MGDVFVVDGGLDLDGKDVIFVYPIVGHRRGKNLMNTASKEELQHCAESINVRESDVLNQIPVETCVEIFTEYSSFFRRNISRERENKRARQ